MDNTIDVGPGTVRKFLEGTDFIVKEYPGNILKFLCGQIDVQRGSKFSRQRINYSLFMRGKDIIMKCSPHLLDTPGEMKVEITRNYIVLTSIDEPLDKITLARLIIK